MTTEPSNRIAYYSLDVESDLTRWLLIPTCVIAACHLAAVIAVVVAIQLASTGLQESYRALISFALTCAAMLTLLHILASFAFFAAYVRWMYLAYRNLGCWQNSQRCMKPGWAVVGHLVPIINFYLAWKVLRELWTGSQLEDSSENGRLVDVWLVVLLLEFSLTLLFHRIKASVVDVADEAVAYALGTIALATFFRVTEYIILASLVGQITDLQEAKNVASST